MLEYDRIRWGRKPWDKVRSADVHHTNLEEKNYDQSKIRDTNERGNDSAVPSSDASFMESSINCKQGVTRKEASLLLDSGIESLSDNDSMAVDDMSDIEWVMDTSDL